MTDPEPLPVPDLTDPWDIASHATLKARRAAPDADSLHVIAYARDYLAYEVKKLAAERDEARADAQASKTLFREVLSQFDADTDDSYTACVTAVEFEAWAHAQQNGDHDGN